MNVKLFKAPHKTTIFLVLCFDYSIVTLQFRVKEVNNDYFSLAFHLISDLFPHMNKRRINLVLQIKYISECSEPKINNSSVSLNAIYAIATASHQNSEK